MQTPESVIRAFFALQCFALLGHFAWKAYKKRDPLNLELRQKCLDIDRKNCQLQFLNACQVEYEETCDDVSDIKDHRLSEWQKKALETNLIQGGRQSVLRELEERNRRLRNIDEIYSQYHSNNEYQVALNCHKTFPGAKLFY